MMVATTEPVRRHRISIDPDVVVARQMGRALAEEIGFGRPEQALIATAISELARNIVRYAEHGELEVSGISRGAVRGLKIVARDTGPGIADIAEAMSDGFSTGNSLGLGLPGTRRIVDDFDIRSVPGRGCTITAIKWLQ